MQPARLEPLGPWCMLAACQHPHTVLLTVEAGAKPHMTATSTGPLQKTVAADSQESNEVLSLVVPPLCQTKAGYGILHEVPLLKAPSD